MIIVIDGYNVLRQVFPGNRRQLDKKRTQFIRELGHYHAKKGQEIVVVFDGGHVSHAMREVRKGVVIVFSGYKSTADEWITDYMKRNKHKELLLVTRDRELIEQCEKYGADAIAGQDFYFLMQDELLQEIESELFQRKKTQIVCKYEREEEEVVSDITSEALDLLMAQAEVCGDKKDDICTKERPKKGKSHLLSKKKRKILRKINKL